jgi:hypothetical protein
MLWLSLLALLFPPAATSAAPSPLPPAGFQMDLDPTDDTALFVVGNTLFATYHELAHALIDVLELPVIGREEDAADGFAAMMMIPPKPDPIRDELIIAVADGWRLLGERTGTWIDHAPLWDEHALDEQRYFSVLCWMVGSDQAGFFDLAEEAGMPPERIETCVDDFTRMRTGWQTLLAGHRPSGDGADRDGEAPIAVVFEEPVQADRDAFHWSQKGGAIEQSILALARSIELPEKVAVRFQSCDDANAFWYRDGREVLICYGLIDEFLSVLVGERGL